MINKKKLEIEKLFEEELLEELEELEDTEIYAAS